MSGDGDLPHDPQVPDTDLPPVRLVRVPEDADLRARKAGVNNPPPAPATGTANGAETDPYRALQAPQGVAPVIVPLWEFAEEQEEVPPPILGLGEEMVLPEGGLLLMYGDGGAGKTTLTLDALAHLASGTSWLGINVPRAFKILLIENEGPRGMLRRRLQEKREWWIAQGRPAYGDNVGVWQDPWHAFNFNLPRHREVVAEYVEEEECDLVMVGPLATLGTIGGGTPEEVNKFMELVQLCWALTKRQFGFWFLHHENKAGDVSGAWERVPDTLVHVQARGNGHTAMVWQKTRWASEHQGTTTSLKWGEGYTFEVEDVKDDRDMFAEIRALMTEQNDRWWTVEEIREELEARRGRVRETLKELVKSGEVLTLKGPPGRHANMIGYRLLEGFTDQELGSQLGLTPEAGVTRGQTGSHDVLGPTGGDVTRSSLHPKGVGGRGHTNPQQEDDLNPDQQGAGSDAEDDGIPW